MKHLSIVAMGPGNPSFLTFAAKEALEGAQVIIGAERLLAELPESCRSKKQYAATRAAEIIDIVEKAEDGATFAVAMSGDTGIFSGTKSLLERLENCETTVIPGVGSVQYFAAQLGRPWQSWRCISAHGIACDPVAELRMNKELFMVTGGKNSVRSLCQALEDAGFGDCFVAVGERLSYDDEVISKGTISEFAQRGFNELSVMLVERSEKAGRWPWAQGGIPDEYFLRGKTPMTKQEVRAVVLAKLKVAADDVVFDIGAGTGSVSVELAFLAHRGRVHAVERSEDALALIAENVKKFALGNVSVHAGSALDIISGLEVPDAVFIGGSGGDLDEIVNLLLEMNPQVRMCIACVTVETFNQATTLLSSDAFTEYEVCQLAVSRTESVGSYSMFKAQSPIFIVSAKGAQ